MERTLQSIVDEAVAPIAQSEPLTCAPIHTLPDGEARHRRKILEYITKHPPEKTEKSLHMGVAGYFNFSIITKTHPNYVILLDSNDNQTRFWQELFSLIAEHSTQEDFFAALAERTIPGGFLCGDGTVLNKRLGSDNAMFGLEALQEEANYRYLHEMALHGRMACSTINLVSESAKARAIGTALREKGFNVNTAYWANIGSFFHATRGGVLRSKDDDIFGHEPREFYQNGIQYKNSGFYKKDSQIHQVDQSNDNRWQGYGSQEQRNNMPDSEVPSYERFLENTSALGGLATLHMHSHASDKIKNIHRYQLILSEGPLRRLPEKVEARKNARDPSHPDWQVRIGEPDNGDISR